MQLLRYMVYIWEDYEKEQEKLQEGISKMSSPDVLEVISRVVATMLRRRNISEDKIADLTDGIRRKPMGQLFEHWDSGPDEELREQGRAEERKNTEAERRRADAAEAENARLREEIARLKSTRS